MGPLKINWNPDNRTLRGFGLIAMLVFAAVGTWLLVRHSILIFRVAPAPAAAAGYALWALAGLCGLLAAAAPRGLRPLYLLLTLLAFPIGLVLSYVLMGLLFFGVFTPIALVFRLIGRDPLCRRFERDAPTYWVMRRPTTDVRRYFRQF